MAQLMIEVPGTKISELEKTSSVSRGDVIPVVQDEETKQADIGQISDFVKSELGSAALKNESDFATPAAVSALGIESQLRDDAQNERIDAVEYGLASKQVGYFQSYATLELANADIANIPLNVSVKVLSAANGGDYYKATEDAISLTKAEYDPINIAAADATAKANAAKEEAAIDATFKANEAKYDAQGHAENIATNINFALQQLIITILDNRDDQDKDIATANTSIELNKTAITRLYLAVQQLVIAISDNRDDQDRDIATANAGIVLNKTAITRLYLGLQQVITTILDIDSKLPSQDEKLEELIILQNLVVQLSKLDGFDPDDIQASAGLASETAIDEDEPLYTFAEPKDIIRIDLTSDYEIPGAKGVVRNGNSKISIDGKVIKLPCTFEVQGSSSASFPKKNLTLGFFTTESRDTAVKIKLGDLMPFDELIYKACWTDAAFCRLAMNYNIYGDMVQSRAGWPKRDVDHLYLGKTGYDSILTGANGHPVMWPCVVYFNGEFYGIGHFGSGKKRQNYNLEKDNPVQIQIDTAGWVNYADLPTYLENNTGDLKAPKTFTSETKAAIQNFATAATSDLDTLRSLIDVNFDKINLIDYILFSMFIANRDTLNGTQVKNAQPVTWDGVKWYIMPYDLDYAQELHFTGSQLIPSVDYNIMTGFLGRVYTIWKDDIDARYAELRQAGVFTLENVYKHLNNIMSAFSEILMKQEFERWPDRPSIDLTNMEQVLTFTQARIQWLDNLYSYTVV
ncbi:CotH kinase family protein [Acinetobacter baumannii]|uniref:CotH kinase family protein n=1 Tax=Acinetobacter baumannii TaxID=470 RepID=UPI00112760E1|nr:CotH kinase family protein [Acinetobacter baumannii]TPS28951.1 hypothetical protein FJV09_05705 [Acinetobacter baumannii]